MFPLRKGGGGLPAGPLCSTTSILWTFFQFEKYCSAWKIVCYTLLLFDLHKLSKVWQMSFQWVPWMGWAETIVVNVSRANKIQFQKYAVVVVRMIVFCHDDSGSNPTEVCSFYFSLKETELTMKTRMAYLQKSCSF